MLRGLTGGRPRVDRRGEGCQALAGDLLAYLLHLIEAGSHLGVHLVDGTSADRVMRMALHEQPPGGLQQLGRATQQRPGAAAGSGQLGPRAEGLRPLLQKRLAGPVALLHPDAGAVAAVEDAVEVSRDGREHPVLHDLVEVPPRRGEHELPAVLHPVVGLDHGRQVLLRRGDVRPRPPASQPRQRRRHQADHAAPPGRMRASSCRR